MITEQLPILRAGLSGRWPITVSELINELSKLPNLQAQVKVRLGWDHPGPLHYTRYLELHGDTPVIGISWGIDDPDRDPPEMAPGMRL